MKVYRYISWDNVLTTVASAKYRLHLLIKTLRNSSFPGNRTAYSTGLNAAQFLIRKFNINLNLQTILSGL